MHTTSEEIRGAFKSIMFLVQAQSNKQPTYDVYIVMLKLGPYMHELVKRRASFYRQQTSFASVRD